MAQDHARELPATAPSAPLQRPLPVRPPLWAELGGWYGTLAILGAYAALSFGWLERGPLYQALNLTGAIGVGGICWYRRTWQALALEAVWALIALAALIGLGAPV
jgi:hypothetical protein